MFFMIPFTTRSIAAALSCERWSTPAIAAERAGVVFTPTRTQGASSSVITHMTTIDLKQVKEIVRGFINNSINIDTLSDDENLFESGLINSLFAIQLTTFVERRFGIEVGMDDLSIENFKSINATAAFVTRKSGNHTP